MWRLNLLPFTLLIYVALLNFKWAKYSPPTLIEDKLLDFANLLAGLYAGYPYWKIGMYTPLVNLRGASFISAVAIFFL